MGLALFSFPENGGSADATQDFAPAQNRFSTPALNSSQNRFGANFQSYFPSSTSPGFPLGHISAQLLAQEKMQDIPGLCTSTIYDSALNDFPWHSDAQSSTSPLQWLEKSLSGLWKCRPAAILPYSASLAKNTISQATLRDSGIINLLEKSSHSSSDTILFPPWLLAAIRVPARHCRQSPFCRRRLAM